MSQLTGSGFLAGATGAAVNEFVQKQLSDAFEDNPDMHQWASAIVGAAVSGAVSGNAQAGASSAVSGTKNNILTEHQADVKYQYEQDIIADPSLTQAEKDNIIKNIENSIKLYDQVQDEVLEKHGYNKWEDVPKDKVDDYLKEANEQINNKTKGFEWKKSLGVNSLIETANLPFAFSNNKIFKAGIAVATTLNQNLTGTIDSTTIYAVSFDTLAILASWLSTPNNLEIPKSIIGQIAFVPKIIAQGTVVDMATEAALTELKIKLLYSNPDKSFEDAIRGAVK